MPYRVTSPTLPIGVIGLRSLSSDTGRSGGVAAVGRMVKLRSGPWMPVTEIINGSPRRKINGMCFLLKVGVWATTLKRRQAVKLGCDAILQYEC